MAKTVSLLAGLIAAAAITYKLRVDVVQSTQDIRERLGNAKTTLDHVAAGTVSQVTSQPKKAPTTFFGESQRYFSHRLVPEVKNTWNAHVTGVAHSLIHADISGKTKKIWDENVSPLLK